MNRIKELRETKGISMKEAARQLEMPYTTYVNYEKGLREPNSETLIEIANFFGVSIDYMLGRSTSPKRIEAKPQPSSDRVRVPVLGRVAAGIPIEAVEEIIDWEDLDAAEYGTGEYFGLKIRGDSMEPKISEGDVVIVRRQDDVNSGDIAIVLVNGDEGCCKKVKKSPQGVTLISNNPAYEPMYFSNDEIVTLPVKVLGRVVELRAKF